MTAPKRGQPITAKWARQLLNLQTAALSQGAVKAGSGVIAEPGGAKGLHVDVFVNNTGAELPPFSVVGIATPTNTDLDSLIYLDSTLDASAVTVCVGPQTVPVGGLFIPVWIGEQPIRVLASGTGFVVGESCGRADGESVVSTAGSGMICVKVVETDCIHVVASGGGSSGTHRIYFEITDYVCISDTEIELTVIALWYTGGCTATIPGEDSYGLITVIDPCRKALHFAALTLPGRNGFATLMWPRTGYCAFEWLLDDICGNDTCISVTP